MKISRRKAALYFCFNMHEITFMLCSMTMFPVLKVKNVSVKSVCHRIHHFTLYTLGIILTHTYSKRLRWSRGSVLAFSTQVHRFKPGRSRRIFKGEKILSTPSFGGEVKPSVPCCRFAACKRSLNGVEVVILAKLPDNILAHSSTFRR